MKSLDEIIKALSIPAVNGYHYIDSNDAIDALHYLKEYRNCGACAYADSYLRCTKEDRNDPLTWSELKQMEGKPVWVEFFYEDGQHFDSDWFLVGFVSESFCDVIGKLGTSWLVKNDYWQAYRKERTE